jgi:hypothetical protein
MGALTSGALCLSAHKHNGKSGTVCIYSNIIQSEQWIYSQTCIKRSPWGQIKSGLIRQLTSEKRFILYEIFYGSTRKRWPFNTGDCLIEVPPLAGLTVFLIACFYCTNTSKSYSTASLDMLKTHVIILLDPQGNHVIWKGT